LTDNKISEVEFEKLIYQIGKRNETYIKFEEVDLEIDKLMPKMLPGRKSEGNSILLKVTRLTVHLALAQWASDALQGVTEDLGMKSA